MNQILKQAIKQPGKPIECQCCGHKVTVRKRPLNSSMIGFLMALYRLSMRHPNKGDGWREFTNHQIVKESTKRNIIIGTDYGELKHWGLAEPKENTDKKKRTSGIWKLTLKGYQFATRTTMINKYVLTYKSKCIDSEGPLIDLVDVLDANFNYEDLISWK